MTVEACRIAISFAEGRPVAIVSIITSAPIPFFSIEAALALELTVENERWCRNITDEVVEAEIAKAGLVPNAGWRLIGDDEIDWNDRTFRNAWIDDGKRVVVDMDRAREVHRDNLRRLRAPKMAALDIEQLRADGDSKKLAKVLAAKQALRDVTDDPSIDAAKTPDELKAVIPLAMGPL